MLIGMNISISDNMHWYVGHVAVAVLGHEAGFPLTGRNTHFDALFAQ